MQPSMKIEIFMLLIQEFSLNEQAQLKSLIYLKQLIKAFINKHYSWKTSRPEVLESGNSN